jgi:hypothetical protein
MQSSMRVVRTSYKHADPNIMVSHRGENHIMRIFTFYVRSEYDLSRVEEEPLRATYCLRKRQVSLSEIEGVFL